MKSYDEFLRLTENMHKIKGVQDFTENVIAEGSEMSLSEADEILNNIEIPQEIREWIELESLGNYAYTHKVTENATRLIDFLPEIDQSLNEDQEWSSLNEAELNEFESALWESVYDYIAAETINEGFWSSMVSKVKAGSKKAVQVAKMVVAGVGKFIKGVIDAGKKGIKQVAKFAVGLGKGIMDTIKGRAEKRMERLNKHSEEQIDKDSEDFGSTVSWFTGKGVDKGIEDGVQSAAKVGGTAMQADEEGKKEAIEKIKKAEMAGKQGSQSSPQKKNESESIASNAKDAYKVINVLQSCSKDELYELVAACFVIELKESGALNENTVESGISEMNISEGLWDKIKKIFGGGKKDSAADAQKELPGVKDEEEKLKKKDEEKAKNTKVPNISAETPENKMEDRAVKAEKSAESGESGLGKILGKVIRLVVQGPILIVEWIAEYGLKKGLKFFSACVKKLGGPGVFLLIAIAAAGAILIGLAIEAAVAGDHESTVAGFFHLGALGSAVAWLHHALEHSAKAAAHACLPIIKWIPVALSAYFAIMHLKHIFHDKKMGKNVNHSKAVELEEDAMKKDEEELNSTDNDEIKELLQEKSDLHQKVIKFHKEQRDRKIKLTEMEKEMKEAKNLMKDHAKKGGVKSEISDIRKLKEKKSELKSEIKDEKKTLEDFGEVKEKTDKETKEGLEKSIESKENEIKELEKALEAAKKKIEEMDDPNGDAKGALQNMEKMKHVEHELHHEEHALIHDFKKFFSDEAGPHLRIKAITEEIKKLKSEKKESDSLHNYTSFLNESAELAFDSYINDLEESYYRDHSTLRNARANQQIDEWITRELGIEIDEELQDYAKIGAKNKYLAEFEDDEEGDSVNEGTYELLPKTKALFNEIEKKYSGFRVGTLSRWERWNYNQDLPVEVETAAKELGAPFDKIQVFRDEDNPDAYDMFVSELPSLRTLSKEGEYTDRRGKKVRFTVTVNC